MTTAELAEVKRLFELHNHQDGVHFMSQVCAFPDKLPRLLLDIMSWSCRVRASTGSINLIFNKASTAHMLTKKDLAKLKGTPTLLIWGKHERILPKNGLSFFQRHLSKKTTTVYAEEEFGHVPFLDDVDRLMEIVEAFFREAAAKTAIADKKT